MAQTKQGDCEICPKTNINITLRYGNMWGCDECWEKEDRLSAEQMSPESQQARLTALAESHQQAAEIKDVIKQSQIIDNGIQTRTDLFNAATVAIVELKKAIDENPEITNKPYALASELKNRFEHFKTVVFELNQRLVEAGNQQKAIQVYLNNLANQLRAEEREKLKIADINYKPQPVKTPTVKKLSTTGTSTKKKASNADIKKAAQELGIAEFTLKAFMVQTGGDLEVAVTKLKKSIEAAKQQ